METTETTRFYLGRMYGERVRVDYYDVANPEEQQAAQHLLDTVDDPGAYYPLVFVDGKLMITGSAEFYHVLRAVQEVVQPAA